MFKKILKVGLLTLVPLTTVYAQSPFDNDPIFKEFQKLQEDMHKVFENFEKNFDTQFSSNMNFPKGVNKGFTFSMKTDVEDKGDYYEIKSDLSGVDEQGIEVKVKENILSIFAKSERKKEEKKEDKIIRKERFIGSFQRSMSLPKDADSDKMKTEYKDGVLTITIPKKK